VRATLPDSVIAPMINGLPGGYGYGAMPSFAGALNNRDMALVANYARVSWGNNASANATPAVVAGLRTLATDDVTGAGGTNAARAFGCPKVGASLIAGTMATPDEANILASGTDADMVNRITSVIQQIRTDNPDAATTDIVNTMVAAYCPTVANTTTLSRSEKFDRLADFNTNVGRLLQETSAPEGPSKALITATLTSAQAQAIATAAQTAGMSPGQWLAKQAATAQ